MNSCRSITLKDIRIFPYSYLEFRSDSNKKNIIDIRFEYQKKKKKAGDSYCI